MSKADLLALTPNEFENLAFDLLQAAGLRNLIWRTPGADGGRDIEGQYLVNDFSGAAALEKWYAECKRYSSPIDWPTLFGKIAYAEVLEADYLLLITNSNPSPQCETKISEWNAERRRVRVRVWRGYEMAQLLEAYPAVAAKYGLLDKAAPIDVEFLPLLLEINKVAQASYVALEFDQSPRSGLEMAASLSELISVRMAQLRAHGKILPVNVLQSAPDYDWLTWSGPIGAWQETCVRAFLTAYRYYLGARAIKIVASGKEAQLSVADCRGRLTPTVEKSLSIIGFWAEIEFRNFDKSNYSLSIRMR